MTTDEMCRQWRGIRVDTKGDTTICRDSLSSYDIFRKGDIYELHKYTPNSEGSVDSNIISLTEVSDTDIPIHDSISQKRIYRLGDTSEYVYLIDKEKDTHINWSKFEFGHSKFLMIIQKLYPKTVLHIGSVYCIHGLLTTQEYGELLVKFDKLCNNRKLGDRTVTDIFDPLNHHVSNKRTPKFQFIQGRVNQVTEEAYAAITVYSRSSLDKSLINNILLGEPYGVDKVIKILMLQINKIMIPDYLLKYPKFLNDSTVGVYADTIKKNILTDIDEDPIEYFDIWHDKREDLFIVNHIKVYLYIIVWDSQFMDKMIELVEIIKKKEDSDHINYLLSIILETIHTIYKVSYDYYTGGILNSYVEYIEKKITTHYFKNKNFKDTISKLSMGGTDVSIQTYWIDFVYQIAQSYDAHEGNLIKKEIESIYGILRKLETKWSNIHQLIMDNIQEYKEDSKLAVHREKLRKSIQNICRKQLNKLDYHNFDSDIFSINYILPPVKNGNDSSILFEERSMAWTEPDQQPFGIDYTTGNISISHTHRRPSFIVRVKEELEKNTSSSRQSRPRPTTTNAWKINRN